MKVRFRRPRPDHSALLQATRPPEPKPEPPKVWQMEFEGKLIWSSTKQACVAINEWPSWSQYRVQPGDLLVAPIPFMNMAHGVWRFHDSRTLKDHKVWYLDWCGWQEDLKKQYDEDRSRSTTNGNK